MIVVIGQTTDISEWLYNSVWRLDRPTKPKFIDHMRRLVRLHGYFRWASRIKSDRIFIIGLLSEAAWVAANQSMMPMEEKYEGVLKKEHWEVFRKKLSTSIWMLRFAPMMRNINVKRYVNVLSSGCRDLTRTQTKVEFTDGTKEPYQAKVIAQWIRLRKKMTRASVLIIARDYASSQGSFSGAYFRGNCQISE